MLIKKIILLGLLVFQKCYADVPAAAAQVVPYSGAITPTATKCNSSSAVKEQQTSGLQFRLPLMDMEIQNQRNLYIIQEPHKQQIYVLHGNELFQMFVSREEKRLSLIGTLVGGVRDMEPLAVEVMAWHNSLIITIVLEEYLEVYQVAEKTLETRAASTKDPQHSNENTPSFEPIQQLALLGKFHKIFLLKPEENKVMLLVAINFTKLYGKFRTFAWSRTYFDLIEELTVPPVHVLSVVGTYPKYLVSGKLIKHQSKTILTIYEVKVDTLNLRNVQTLTVNSRTIHTLTFRNKSYIIACASTQKKCNTFRMTEGQFGTYKRRSSKELSFDKITASKHYLVASLQNEIKIFTNARLDCYGSFMANDTDISSIITHSNDQGEDFILLNYKRPFSTLVRMVGIETESGELLGAALGNSTDVEEMTAANQFQHIFENSIGELRSLLLKRKTTMDVFRKVGSILMPKYNKLTLKNSVHLHSGNIGIIKVVGKALRSPKQLLERIEEIRHYFSKTRTIRSLDVPTNFTLNLPLQLRVQHLKVKNLIYDGNIMEGFHLDDAARPLPILSARSKLTTNIIHTPKLYTRQNNTAVHHNTRGVFKNNAQTTKIQRLNVKRINGVVWDEFYDMLFLKNRDTKLKGRLVLQAETKVVNLNTPRLNGLIVEHLFNLRQPQVVHSNILISRFHVNDLRAERINGLNFTEDIVFRGRENFIETPVRMYELSIVEDLIFGDNTKYSRVLNEADEQEEIPFQQHYTGKVIINGTLTVNNLNKDDPIKTTFVVDNITLNEANVKQHYLLQNTTQNFTTEVIFGNSKVTVPSLKTNYLNEYPTQEHLLNDVNATLAKPIYIVFMTAQVEGDLICNNFISTILELNATVIRHGDVANVTGHKTFAAALTVNELMTLTLGNMSVNDLVLKSQLNHTFGFVGAKSFENIVVAGKAYIEKALNADYLNNLPLSQLLNYEYYLDCLEVPHKLQTTNIVFHKLNGVPFDEVFLKFNVNDDNLVLHKNLIIEGNVQFLGNISVTVINDLDWEAYYATLIHSNESAVIEGNVRFLRELTITKEVQTNVVNNIDMDEVFESVLSKSKPQQISGSYTFGSVKLPNLDVSAINGISTEAFIDMRAKEVVIDSDIIVPKITTNGNIKGNFVNVFQFYTLTERLIELPKRQWRNLVVLGNAMWNTSDAGDKTQLDQLQYLYKHAVQRSGNQVITGNVKLRRPLISKMITKTAFIKDIDLIAKDCLLKNTTLPQTVVAAKTFIKPLNLQYVEAVSALQMKLLNDIDILRLNASLYRLSSGEPINGPLSFKTPPNIGRLTVEGLVNGIKAANIYHMSNHTPMPPTKINTLVIDNFLEIFDINDMSLNYLLENRVTKHGDALEVFGFLTFENLILNKEILLQSINGIPIDNLVYMHSNHLQALSGAKFIDGSLVLAGPAHVMSFNDRDLIDAYQQAVLRDLNYQFDNLEIDQATFEKGFILENDMLALTKERSNVTANEMSKREKYSVIKAELQEIDSMSLSQEKNRLQHLLYLDYDTSTELLWQNPNETTEKIYNYEISRNSLCERQILQLSKSQISQRMYLTNITTNMMSANAHGYSVKAQNYCNSLYRKVKSKITIMGKKLLKVFGMKKSIESIEIYAPTKQNVFILLHAVDLAGNRNEVRILRIDNSANNISDWQSLTLGVGRTMRLFYIKDYAIVACSGLVNNHPAVTLYKYENHLQQFKLLQIIDGDYDIIELVSAQAENKYQLILSCHNCQRINIYELTASSETPYQIFQMLKLKSLIDKLFTFVLSDGNLYLLVLPAHSYDYYHLYRYSHIEGWLHFTYGYFHNIEIAVPLRAENLSINSDNSLLLLCSSDKCSLVKAFVN